MITNKQGLKWAKNMVFSLKLRNNHFVLMQMMDKGHLIVFNHFREIDEWNDLTLQESDILFKCYALKNFKKKSSAVYQKKIKPLHDIPPDYLHLYTGPGTCKITLWPNTNDERTFILLGQQGQVSIRRRYFESNKLKEEYTPIPTEEYDKYKHYELTNLCEYPSFNERLLLCEFYGTNFDPLRELAFNRPLDLRCKTYIDIISGQVELSKLGY